MSGRYARVKRDYIKFVLYPGTDEYTIKPGWLKGKSNDVYRKAVKTALMIGAKMLEIERLIEFGEEAMAEEIAEAERELQRIKEGKVDPNVQREQMTRNQSTLSGKKNTQKGKVIKWRKTMVGPAQTRDFTIKNGELRIYSSSNVEKKYDLKDLTIEDFAWQKKTKCTKESFKKDHEYRIALSHKDHQSAMYLYSDDPAKDPDEIYQWYFAIKMARGPHARMMQTSLTTYIRKMLSSVMDKGWRALQLRNDDLMRTRELMHQFTIRLLRRSLAGGWNKWSALYQARCTVPKIEREARVKWGLSALAERIQARKASPQYKEWELREKVIDLVQQKFRKIRKAQDERSYSFTTKNCASIKSVASREQQAKRGVQMFISYEAIKRSDTFQLVCDENTYQVFLGTPENLRDKVFSGNELCYAEEDLPFLRGMVYTSDNLKLLRLSESSERGNHLEKASFSQFVRVDNISGVLLHAPRVAGSGDQILSSQLSMQGIERGPTFTIFGPKIAWNQCLVKAESEEKVGEDTFEKLTREDGPSEDLKWLKVSIKCSRTMMEEPKKASSGENAKKEGHQISYAVVHFLGKRFTTPRHTHLYNTGIDNICNEETFVVAVPGGTKNSQLNNFQNEIVSIDVRKQGMMNFCHKTCRIRQSMDADYEFVAMKDFTILALGRSVPEDGFWDGADTRIGLWDATEKKMLAEALVRPESATTTNDFAYSVLEHKVCITKGKRYRMSQVCTEWLDTWNTNAEDLQVSPFDAEVYLTDYARVHEPFLNEEDEFLKETTDAQNSSTLLTFYIEPDVEDLDVTVLSGRQLLTTLSNTDSLEHAFVSSGGNMITNTASVPLYSLNESDSGDRKALPAALQQATQALSLFRKSATENGSMDVEISIEYVPLKESDNAYKSKSIVSPEVFSIGPSKALYPSLKGAWFNRKIGLSKFDPDEGPSMAQLNIRTLKFPENDPPSDKAEEYFIELTLMGLRTSSMPLVRPKKEWGKIFPGTDSNIYFDNTKLNLLIPPRFWDLEKPPPIDVCVYKCSAIHGEAVTWSEFEDKSKKRIRSKLVTNWEKVYAAKLDIPDVIIHEVFFTDSSFKDLVSSELRESWRKNLAELIESRLSQGRQFENQSAPPKVIFCRDKNGSLDGMGYILIHNVVDDAATFVEEKLRMKCPNLKIIKDDNQEFSNGFKPRKGLRLPMDSANNPNMEIQTLSASVSNFWQVDQEQAVLECDFSICNRDHIKSELLDTPDSFDSVSLSGASVCVGDKITLKVERPQTYPISKIEYRRRYMSFSAPFSDQKRGEERKKKEASRSTYEYELPLRQPALIHEYINSGLDLMAGGYSESDKQLRFEQTFIPDFCRDVVPYKYVLPLSERQFILKRLPGIYWRVADQLCKANKENLLVETLTHLYKNVVATVIAVHNNRTVDVDITSFVADWKKDAHHEYALPGNPVKFNDDANNQRYLLKDVPLHMVTSIQSGFNLYDARSTSSETSTRYKTNFDPKSNDMKDDRGGYDLMAGPMPNDSNPAACQYEWKIHCQAEDERTMCHFVQMLRHVVREDHFNQAQKIVEMKEEMLSQNENGRSLAQKKKKTCGGYLEVVLVEARRLRKDEPLGYIKSHAKNLGKTLTKGISDRPAKAFAKFKLKRKRRGGTSEMIPIECRGNRSHTARPSDNPKWNEGPDMEKQGGYVFRTRNIEQVKMDEYIYVLEIDILDQGLLQIGGQRQLSSCELKLNGENEGMIGTLMDPEQPFRNFWRTLDKGGEVHFMTLYHPNVTSDRRDSLSPLSPGRSEFDRYDTVVKWLDYECESLPSPLRDPFTNDLVTFGLYDPNFLACRRQKKPQMLEDQGMEESEQTNGVGDNTVEDEKENIEEQWELVSKEDYQRKCTWQLYNSKDYIDCIKAQQRNRVKEEIQKEKKDFLTLWSMFVHYHHLHEHNKVEELKNIFLNGIPPELRWKVWKDIYQTKWNEAEKEERTPPILKKEYKTLVAKGKYLNECITTDQLIEDFCSFYNDRLLELKRDEFFNGMENRLKKAREICMALIYCQDSQWKKPGARVVYEEALLHIAYYMLLSNDGIKDERGEDPHLEVNVFWTMYALIGGGPNEGFSAYFGSPARVQRYSLEGRILYETKTNTTPIMIGRNGVMADLSLLDSALSVMDKELWLHFQGVGFQLFTFFHKAFLRWFAGFLPSPTLLQFWDYLFFTVMTPTNEEQSNSSYVLPDLRLTERHPLIDLALTTMEIGRDDLMHCQSSLQIFQCLETIFKNQWDPTELMHLLRHTHVKTWTHQVNKVNIMVMHRHHQKYFDMFLGRKLGETRGILGSIFNFRESGGHESIWSVEEQNNVLKTFLDFQLSDRSDLTIKVRGKESEALYFELMPKLRMMFSEVFERQKKANDRVKVLGAMHRPLPESVLNYGDLGGAQWIETATKTGKEMLAQFNSFFTMERQTPRPFPQLITDSCNGGGATYDVDLLDQEKFMEKMVPLLEACRSSDKEIFHHLFDQFRAIQGKKGEEDGGFSPVELLTSIIICSEGTMSMKALALFGLFGYHNENYDEKKHDECHHVLPKTPSVQHLIESTTWRYAEHRTLVKYIPDNIDQKPQCKQYGLQVNVYSDAYQKKKLYACGALNYMGTFTCSEDTIATVTHIPLYGSAKNIGDGNEQGDDGYHYDYESRRETSRSFRGELKCRIKWIPLDRKDRISTGDIEIEIIKLKLASRDPKINPYLEFKYYDEKKDKLCTCASIKSGGGSYYPPIAAESLDDGSGKKAGYDADSDNWFWGPIGRMSGTKKLNIGKITLLKEFFDPDSKENCIDIRAIRLIVQMIAMRCMIPITLRQAILHADHTFSPLGAVAGIQDAYLVQELPEHVEEGHKRMGSMWKTTTNTHCVKKQLLQEWERQINNNFGDLNFFPDGPVKDDLPLTLNDLNINSPFKNSEQTLVVRYTSAGDGKQRLRMILVDDNNNIIGVHEKKENEINGHATGSVHDKNESNRDVATISKKTLIPFDPYRRDPECSYYKITKEEYLNCFLSNTLLSESMRSISSTLDKATLKKKRVRLQVHMANPMGFDGITEDFMPNLEFGQSILLEIWDKDRGSTDTFMGEAWLPNLNEFRVDNLGEYRAQYGKDPPFVERTLIIGEANEDTHDNSKNKRKNQPLPDGIKRGGKLEISAIWEYPVTDKTVEEAKRDKTGRLKLFIKQASKLAKTDSGKKGMFNYGYADPYVVVWIRNDITREWYPAYTNKKWSKLSLEKLQAKTAVKSSTIDPKWNETFEIDITSASYECASGTDRSLTGIQKLFYRSKSDNNVTIETQSGKDPIIYFLDDGIDQKVLDKLENQSAKLNLEKDDDKQSIAKGIKIKDITCHGLRLDSENAVENLDKLVTRAKVEDIRDNELHGVQINMSDTILEFKNKVIKAVRKLNAKIEGLEKLGRPGRSPILEPGPQHQVFVFKPPPKLTAYADKIMKEYSYLRKNVAAAGKAIMEVFTEKQTYATMYQDALLQPNNYEPLDPMHTFEYYSSMYGFGNTKLPGFGKGHTPVIRILEANQGYAAKNENYRSYLQRKSRALQNDMGGVTGDFAWVKRKNEDGTSTYSKALVEPAKGSKPGYQVNHWYYVPKDKQKAYDRTQFFEEEDVFFCT